MNVDIEAVKLVNREIIQTQSKQDKLTDRLENLASNSNIKYLNFKVMSTALFVGLIIGVLCLFIYMNFVDDKKKEVIVFKDKVVKVPIYDSRYDDIVNALNSYSRKVQAEEEEEEDSLGQCRMRNINQRSIIDQLSNQIRNLGYEPKWN